MTSTCTCNCLSPFRWPESREPTVFARDHAFTTGASSGKSKSQASSEAVDRFTARTGRNPGSLKGMSASGDLRIEEAEAKRKRQAA